MGSRDTNYGIDQCQVARGMLKEYLCDHSLHSSLMVQMILLFASQPLSSIARMLFISTHQLAEDQDLPLMNSVRPMDHRQVRRIHPYQLSPSQPLQMKKLHHEQVVCQSHPIGPLLALAQSLAIHPSSVHPEKTPIAGHLRLTYLPQHRRQIPSHRPVQVTATMYLGPLTITIRIKPGRQSVGRTKVAVHGMVILHVLTPVGRMMGKKALVYGSAHPLMTVATTITIAPTMVKSITEASGLSQRRHQAARNSDNTPTRVRVQVMRGLSGEKLQIFNWTLVSFLSIRYALIYFFL
jgi:hypothetical protein